jgi:DNA-directed RNA polymerase subunit RPC12/RpoP
MDEHCSKSINGWKEGLWLDKQKVIGGLIAMIKFLPLMESRCNNEGELSMYADWRAILSGAVCFLNKDHAESPVFYKDDDGFGYFCPDCGAKIGSYPMQVKATPCLKCGKEIDWDGED